MSPSKANTKPFTPGSVKGLMIVEAAVLACLGVWMVNEYLNNIYWQISISNAIGTHLTTYTMIIGITIGLGGTAVAFTLWKNLREARYKLEHIASPRLRGSVRRALSALPTIDEESTSTPRRSTTSHAETPPSSTTFPRNPAPSTPEAQQTPTLVQTVPPAPPSQQRQDEHP